MMDSILGQVESRLAIFHTSSMTMNFGDVVGRYTMISVSLFLQNI